VISCLAAALAAYFYFYAANRNSDSLKVLGRRFFQLQAFAVVSIFVILFYIIFSHRYEFYYAWKHSSNALPVYYMISCFWEGQEGSFLLWMFWNATIGLVLTRKAGSWESPVMAVVGLAQFALATMLLGFEWGELHIGSTPFALFRDIKADMIANIPVLEGKAKYLMALKDGNGLNPLLQNYWMVIHPPTLFLGFALTVVPFAYSIAGLWMRRDREWLKPALKWSLLCVGVLGVGIVMGGFWAYESLSFGGYWAWDPVENASLMPWLIMAAAAHMILISRNTGRHLFTSHLLIQLSYWLVLYATFLTRSGILGDASVHSFTDLGLSGQLLLFMFAFYVVSLLSTENSPVIRRAMAYGFFALVGIHLSSWAFLSGKAFDNVESMLKNIDIGVFFAILISFLILLSMRTSADPSRNNLSYFQAIKKLFSPDKEFKQADEKWSSRELWMFLGSMFLILSLVQVISATSIPVFNKLFGTNTAIPKAEAYNKAQVWLAMPVMFLMAIGQYFRYRETKMDLWLKDFSIAFGLSLLIAMALMFGFGIYEIKYVIFLVFSVQLIVSNILFIRKQKLGDWLGNGSSIAHSGFGILLMGVLVSSVNQTIISSSQGINLAPEVNEKGQADAKAMDFNRQNRILYKDKSEEMGMYTVTYRSFLKGTGKDSIDKYFNVLFELKDKTGKVKDSFTLKPKTQNNPNMGLLAEPSTRHFLYKDVFTHVNYESSMDKAEPFSAFKQQTVKEGQMFLTESGKVKLQVDSFMQFAQGGGFILRLAVKVERLDIKETIHPEYVINLEENILQGIPVTSDKLGLYFNIEKINVPAPGEPRNNITFDIVTAEKDPAVPYIVVKAIEFPWINLVWAGTIIMAIGTFMALIFRIKMQRKLQKS